MPDTRTDALKTPHAAVKVFGERNTGTNAFAKLIRRNSDSEVLPTQIGELRGFSAYFGRTIRRLAPRSMHETLTDWVFSRAGTLNAWKHCATYFSDAQQKQLAGHPIFIMVRHPASWLVGLQRKPYHALQPTPPELADFLDSTWKTVARDGLEQRDIRPTALYNEKLRSYLEFERAMAAHGGTVKFIRFEDFVMDQLAVFKDVAPYLDNPRADPRIIASSTKKSGKSAEDYARYYRDQVWADTIDPAARDIIKTEIDWDAAARFYSTDDWRNMGGDCP